MLDEQTSIAVQRYLDELAGAPGATLAEPIVAGLIGRSVDRLQLLCASLLHKSYPRLTRGPLNLCPDDVLGAVVERMLKAMRQVHPQTVRQFFALAYKHVRWELNDLARRLDAQSNIQELHGSRVPAPVEGSAESGISPALERILAAIENLPEEEREVFNLVRIQGMTWPEAAQVVGVSIKTIQRRLNRSLVLLAEQLGDLGASADPSTPS